MPIEYVRVKDDSTGAEFSQPVARRLNGLTVLKDKDAVDEAGHPLPAKTRRTLAESGETAPKRSRRTKQRDSQPTPDGPPADPDKE